MAFLLKRRDILDLQFFKKTLKNKLHEKKLTLSALSLQADLSEDTLRSIIYGKSQDIKLSTLTKIANVLECSLDELIGRSIYSDKEVEIIKRLRRLSSHSLRNIDFLLDFEEKTTVFPSTEHKKVIPCIKPTGNFKNGMFFDSSIKDVLDISNYPDSLKRVADYALTIFSRNFEPVYYPTDTILLSHSRMPVFNDTVLYLDKEGRIYFMQYTETCLQPVNGFGKIIPLAEASDYSVKGVVIKVIKEFNIEQFR